MAEKACQTDLSSLQPSLTEKTAVTRTDETTFEKLKEQERLLAEIQRYKNFLTALDALEAKREQIEEQKEDIKQSKLPQTPSSYLNLKYALKTEHKHIAPDGLCGITVDKKPHIVSVGSEGEIIISDLTHRTASKLTKITKKHKRKLTFAFSAKIKQEQFFFVCDDDGMIEIWTWKKRFKLMKPFLTSKSWFPQQRIKNSISGIP